MDQIKAFKIKRRNYDIYAKPNENVKVYRDRVITALFNTRAVQNEVLRICQRNRISPDTLIHEDITQEVFYWLLRHDPANIVRMYESNPESLVGLSVRIAILKGVAKKDDKPYNSMARYILYGSAFAPGNTEVNDAHLQHETAADLLQEISEHLDSETVDFLRNLKPGRGRAQASKKYFKSVNIIANAFQRQGYKTLNYGT